MNNKWVMRLPWDKIDDVASEHKIPSNLLAAIAQTESSGNQFALRAETKHTWVTNQQNKRVGLVMRSHYVWPFRPEECARSAGTTEDTEIWAQVASYGYCQLMGAVARELGLRGSIFALLDGKTNLEYAAKLLKRLAARYTEKNDILAAYNAGSAVKNLKGLYRNQDYVDKVNERLVVIDQFLKGK